MKYLYSNQHILLRLTANADNVAFVTLTFAIIEYLFYDDRLPGKQIKSENPDKFNEDSLIKLRDKCLEINNNIEVALTINEFILFSKTVDFVSKSFLGEFNHNLSELITKDLNDPEFDYDLNRSFYFEASTKLFEGFRKSCTNKKINEILNRELNWGLDL